MDEKEQCWDRPEQQAPHPHVPRQFQNLRIHLITTQDTDLTAVQYARRHGLTRPSVICPDVCHPFSSFMVEAADNDDQDIPIESLHLPDFPLQLPQPNTSERLVLSKRATDIIQQSCGQTKTTELHDALRSAREEHEILRPHRVELPLLLSNNEQDMIEYWQIAKRIQPLRGHMPPEEPTDAEDVESPESRKVRDRSRRVHHPKLCYPRSAIKYLQTVLCAEWTLEHHQSFIRENTELLQVSMPFPCIVHNLPPGILAHNIKEASQGHASNFAFQIRRQIYESIGSSGIA